MEKVIFDQVVKVGCGIDVHKDIIVATIRRSEKDYETKEFSSFTSSLTELREWCKSEGVTHIAMESTGVYWKPVFNILEDGDFEIILVNARHVRNVPGHKTDKQDSQWLSKLLLSGLLKASFIPPAEIRDLRDLVRYKKKVVSQASSEKNRIIRILEDANIKLSSVLTNVDGAVGSRIIDDLIAGKTDINGLMQHYHGHIKASKEEFRKALQGRLTKHHQFMLRVIKESITDKERLIEKIEKQIDELAKRYSVEIELLQTIPGVAYDSAVGIISEIGADMKQFSSDQHLSSWAGMSPGNNESGGKKKSTTTIHGNKHLQTILVESAWGATRKKDGYMKRKYQSLVPRRGKKKAIVAVGHKIIIAAYHVIKDKEAYKEPVLHNNPKRRTKQVNNLLNKLSELGVVVKQLEISPIV